VLGTLLRAVLARKAGVPGFGTPALAGT
jgi:hypothetical protein